MPSDINVGATREIANRANNLFLPIYTDDEAQRKFCAPVEEHDALDQAFGRASGEYNANASDETMLDVFMRLARILPALNIVSTTHDPGTADFHWARLRCVFAGVGFPHHAKLAARLCDAYPMCGMRPDETEAEWQTSLREAHQMCGWPVTLGLVGWAELRHCIQFTTKDDLNISDWHKIVSLLHVLKHLRYSRHFGLVVVFGGRPVFVEAPKGTNICTRRQTEPLMLPLGLPPARGKVVHPLTAATTAILLALPLSELLERQPLSDIPGYVLAGPWSRLHPDPQAMHGFVQHGSRMSNVWIAENGRVEPVPGGTSEIINYDWNLAPGEEDAAALERFRASLPDVYDMNASPADVFLQAFPNTSFERYRLDPRAFAAVFDACMCAGLMRLECPVLQRERPFMLFMPANPHPEDSTNQGKTYAGDVVANAFAPGIGRAQGIPLSTNAPDMRALAGDIERMGTLNIDEWVMPTAPQHLLCHRNLQTLFVGGQINVGKAYENGSFPIALKFPLIANTKVFYVPPDLVNRCVPVFLETFTNAQRAHTQILNEIETGKTSVKLRLAALGTMEKLHLVEYINAGQFGTTNEGSRYQGIRALSIRILEHRQNISTAGATELVDAYMEAVRGAITAHTREAESSGLLSMQMDGDSVNVRAYAIFAEIGLTRIEELVQVARQESTDQGRHGLSPTAILKGRLTVAGVTNNSLSTLLNFIGGRARNVGDRVMALAFARDLKSLLPHVGASWLLPDICGERGWTMKRMADCGGAIRVSLAQIAPPTHIITPQG